MATFKELVGNFFQELGGSILLIALLFPFGSFFGDTWNGWIAHFFMVMLADYISAGSQVNPAVSVATWVYGWATFDLMCVRILGQIVAATVMFPLVSMFTPSYVTMGGPQLAPDSAITKGVIYEATLTAGLLVLILAAVTKVGLPGQRPIIAIGIRSLIYVGAHTGPAMNPMIAFGWAWFGGSTAEFFTLSHLLVYWVAPIAGAVAGVLIWQTLEQAFSCGSCCSTDSKGACGCPSNCAECSGECKGECKCASTKGVCCKGACGCPSNCAECKGECKGECKCAAKKGACGCPVNCPNCKGECPQGKCKCGTK